MIYDYLRSCNCQNLESQKVLQGDYVVSLYNEYIRYIRHRLFQLLLVVVPSMTARSREGFGRAHRQSMEQEQRLTPGGGGPVAIRSLSEIFAVELRCCTRIRTGLCRPTILNSCLQLGVGEEKYTQF